MVCVRGHFREYFYDDSGTQTAAIDMIPEVMSWASPPGRWHSLESLESGTLIQVCKNGKWKLLGRKM